MAYGLKACSCHPLNVMGQKPRYWVVNIDIIYIYVTMIKTMG